MLPDIDYKSDYDKFSQHFRKLLNERIRNDNTLTQTSLGKMMQKSQNAINNWLTENKKYQCVPNAIDFIILCKILNLNPEKFLDLNYILKDDVPAAAEYSADRIFYIETSVSRDIKKIFNECYLGKKLSAVITISHNGAGQAIEKFVQCNRQYAIILEEPESIPHIKQQITRKFNVSALSSFLENQKLLFIVMNAEYISQAGKDAIIKEFYPGHALLFIYNQETAEDPFLKRNISKFYLKSITKYDIIEILDIMFPGIKSDAVSVIEALSGGRLDVIMEIAGKIQNRYMEKRKISKKDILDIIFN